MHFKRLVFCAALFLLCACPVHLPLTANRLESPEVLGITEVEGKTRYHGAGDLAIVGQNILVLSPSSTESIVNPQTATYDTSASLAASAAFGILDVVELGIMLDNYVWIKGKYQILGASRAKSDVGNTSLSITAKVGNSTLRHNATSSSKSTQVATTNWLVDSAVIAGYRVLKPVLLYSSFFVTGSSFTGNHTISTSGTVTANEDFRGSALQYGINIGAEMSASVIVFRVEMAYAHLNSGPVNTGRGSPSFLFGLNLPLGT